MKYLIVNADDFGASRGASERVDRHVTQRLPAGVIGDGDQFTGRWIRLWMGGETALKRAAEV